MTTLVRLLKIVRSLNTSLSKRRLSTVNFEKLSADTLLNSQTVLSTNGHQNHEFTVTTQPQINKQDFGLGKKMEVINKKVNKYGKIADFDIEDILNDIKKLGTVTSLQGLFLLQWCSELIDNKSPALKIQLGEEIWKTLKTLNVELDVSHYNSLLNIYLENEHNFSPIHFLEKMLAANVKPNKVTFQRLILRFCNQGKIAEANQIMKHMEKGEVTVNEEILSSFIWGHVMNNNTDGVCKTLEEMKSLKIIPTIRSYATLMYAYAVNGDIDNIRQTLANCKDKNIWVPDKVLLKVIYHLSLSGFTDHVDEILSMTTKGALYKKDANRMICKLIEKQQDNVAFKIFQTLQNPKTHSVNPSSTNFFIDTLVNFEVPIEKSIKYYQIMAEEGIHQKSFSRAICKSLENDMYDSSISLMKAWNDLGGQIKECYFYSILVAYGEIGQCQDTEKVLQKMVLDFGLTPSAYALKTHVLPYMQGSAHDTLISLINSCINHNVAQQAILIHLLSENKIQEANEFMHTYNIKYKINNIKYNLLQAFKNTEDAPAFVSILHYIYSVMSGKKKKMDVFSTDNKYQAQQFIDSCITEAMVFISPNNKYLLLMLFRNLVYKGLSISPEIMVEFEKNSENYLTKDILNNLNILKSGNLVPKPIVTDFPFFNVKKFTDVGKLESIAKILTVTNKKTATYIKKNLLYFYCNNLNEQKVEELLEEWKTNNLNMTSAIYISLLNMYLNLQKPDKAEFWLCQWKKLYPLFKFPETIILKLATALIDNGQIQKAQEYLTWSTSRYQFDTHNECCKLLNSVCKLNDEELLQTFFDLLLMERYILKPDYTILNPFIQIHLLRNDIAAAIQKFEWAYKTYRQVPCKIELMKACIKYNDYDSLEKIKNICNSVIGKTETDFLVAIAYLENNNLLKAIDIIQRDCIELYEKNVIYFAKSYYYNGQINYLEKLFEVLNALKFDVEKLCVLLLKGYSMQKEWKKGYNLWMKMQKEEIIPSNTFINCLNLIMREKNEQGNDSLQKFNTAVYNCDFKAAEELLNNLPLIFKADCYSLLCKEYYQMNKISSALNLWQELEQKWHLELDSDVAEDILSKLVYRKDINSIERIGSHLSIAHQIQSNYKFYLNQVYLQSGSWNVFLKKCENKLEDASYINHITDFHNKTVVDSLIKYPELTQQFEDLAHKFMEKDIWIPIQILWIYYFLQKNVKADEIWVWYLKNQPYCLWLSILNYRNFPNNADTYLQLANLIKLSSVRRNNKFLAYSKIIRGCMDLNDPKRYEYGLKSLEIAMQDFSMEKFDISLLADLQVGLENSGIVWPWSIKLNNIDDKVGKVITDLPV